MPGRVIDNPILNSPYLEPSRHFRFDEGGITPEVVVARRPSSCLLPLASERRRNSGEPAQEAGRLPARLVENRLVNRIRARVARWRANGYGGVTPTTARLLAYWTARDRDQRLFFFQLEAAETAIYINEVARAAGDYWIERALRAASEQTVPVLPRIALKMATGTGKTVVMAMLIAWQALNKLARPQDARFSNAFLIVTPGITVRDRLRVLLPHDRDNYYRRFDLVTAADLGRLARAKILVTNYHAFLPRDRIATGKLTKSILATTDADSLTESPDEVVRRACRTLGTSRNIVVINDEAHHCYTDHARVDGGTPRAANGRLAVALRNDPARVWISGLEAVRNKMGVRAVYDLSATPFFLRGSGYPEGTLFPWVVSDASLIDAIEAGIVKVPRTPPAVEKADGVRPTGQNLWVRVRDKLPSDRRRMDEANHPPPLPSELLGALDRLYRSYERQFRRWQNGALGQCLSTPPVFLVVCSNTSVSRHVFDYIAGWERVAGGSTVVQPGQLPIFRNDDGRGGWLARPNTILIDSRQLESGRGLSCDFKRVAARRIAELKHDGRGRFAARNAARITDEQVLREVINTIGHAGKLGENVKCIVSVAMLSEGWDARTVTHVLGVRAFSTQLLCEQVVGRALRRTSYAPDDAGMLLPEYAEVDGVPFSFLPCRGLSKAPAVGPTPTSVRALAERSECEIVFPRVVGYYYDSKPEHINVQFTDDSGMRLSSADVPADVGNTQLVDGRRIQSLDDLRSRRLSEVAFRLAGLTMEKYLCRDGLSPLVHPPSSGIGRAVRPWLFPQVLAIVRRWLAECVTTDGAFLQLLLIDELAQAAADRIARAIGKTSSGPLLLMPILDPHAPRGSTRDVAFDTARTVVATRADKCHLSHAVIEPQSNEQQLVEALEEVREVRRYVKNHRLGFVIPYAADGAIKQYVPDFLACIDDGRGDADLLNLLIDTSGPDRERGRGRTAVRDLWLPAVNRHGGLGRWGLLKIDDSSGAVEQIRRCMITSDQE